MAQRLVTQSACREFWTPFLLFLQLVPLGRSRITASRLTGDFECVVSDSARLELADIPSQPGAGSIWVWPTFMPGTAAVYSPPLPGYVDHFLFPPANSSGIEQSFQIDRCAVRLWPLLVRENTTLTLADIPEENWVVVGLYLPQSTTITGLTNRLTYEDQILSLEDRTLRLSQASIDTWNLYPVLEAQVAVRNCLIGELLAGDSTRVEMEGTIVDGTGGHSIHVYSERSTGTSGRQFGASHRLCGRLFARPQYLALVLVLKAL